MKTKLSYVTRAWQALRAHPWVVIGALIALACLLSLGWLGRLATTPGRRAGAYVALGPYGVPGVDLKIVHPTRLGPETSADHATTITVLARARSQEATQAVELVLPLPDEAIAFVDLDGTHVPGRMAVVPGHPDALPYDLRVVHGDTQLQGRLLRSYRASILPLIRIGGQTTPVPDLAFEIRLESRWTQACRAFALAFFSLVIPCLTAAALALLAVWILHRVARLWRLSQERQLASIHAQLRQHIRLERWGSARREIERVRLMRPHYRDLDQLDAQVSAAETATRRQEQLYEAGNRAYKSRDWPMAAQAFASVESEAPYYRDVRFLRRTAVLYADLRSRDRSRRVTAARELGEVADLLEMTPLLRALGDRSEEVADAAEASFQRIGLEAFDVLLGGLAGDSEAVRQRAYRLIEGYGQRARNRLLAALRGGDPRITAAVAALLVALGARQELAEALLRAPPEHQAGIVRALVGEGLAAFSPLVSVLLTAPPERQGVLINALAALKSREEIDRRLEEALRATKDPREKGLLQRVLNAKPATPQRGGGASPVEKVSAGQVSEKDTTPRSGRKPRMLGRRLLDRRRP